MERHLVQLLVKGVGWRVERRGNSLHLHLGYSVVRERPLAAGVEVIIQGADKEGTRLQLVSTEARSLGDYAASLRRLRPFNPYTGHGIVRLDKGVPARKAGKRKG